MPLKLVALVGRAGSGKDTVARMMPATAISFAEPMKRFAQEVFGWSDEQLFGASHLRNVPDPRFTRPTGEPLTPRHALQTLGTDWGRQCDPDVWIKLALRRAAEVPGRVVITDCRFKNEAAAVRAAGGEVWKIIRPGVQPLEGNHASEAEIDGIEADAQLWNMGTLEDLRRDVGKLCNWRGFR